MHLLIHSHSLLSLSTHDSQKVSNQLPPAPGEVASTAAPLAARGSFSAFKIKVNKHRAARSARLTDPMPILQPLLPSRKSFSPPPRVAIQGGGGPPHGNRKPVRRFHSFIEISIVSEGAPRGANFEHPVPVAFFGRHHFVVPAAVLRVLSLLCDFPKKLSE